MESKSIRHASVAGSFYPSDKVELKKLIEKILRKEKKRINYSLLKETIYGAVVPHAGYVFSAYQAIHFFALLQSYKTNYDTFIIINPNHTGYGARIALSSHDFWETPFGLVKNDKEFSGLLGFEISDIAHKREHSGEVMLPFLQFFLKYDFKIVPITLSQQNPENARLLAKKIHTVAKKLDKKIAIIASSDFSHFLSPQKGHELDDLVLEQIKNQDIDKLYNVVKKYNISVCGFGTIMTLMAYSELNGNYNSHILLRGHSGDVVPSNEVVDYISILFSKSNL